MTVDALGLLYETFTQSVFRLETLQHYEVTDDAERLRAFQEGRPLPLRPAKEEWLQFVREAIRSGRRIHRVHVLNQPLTLYLRYELVAYRENTVAGEEVGIADRAHNPALGRLREDFILFDADTRSPAVVWMRYSREGRIASRDLSEDPQDVRRCRDERDLALAHSVPLEKFQELLPSS